jgi:sucrose phosphorylase
VLWTTFTPQQIDINVFHPEGARYLDGILRRFADSGIRAIRLDAAGYAVKKAGTSCFMLPETHAFIDDFTRRAHALGIEVLVEIHAHYSRQIEIARHVDWVYDFALPPLLLHAFVHGVAEPLQRWVAMRPTNSLTVLDTHDGIGIIDIGADAHEKAARPGLVPPEELERLVEAIHANSNGQSRRATGAAASNLDLYQVNCTYYDALARDDLRYLLARAVQLFLPGIPQIYYMGLLAEPNDMALLEQTGVGRDINRHRFSRDEVLQALQRPVVADLLGLVRLRNTLPAFGGTFRCAMPAPSVLELSWFRSQSCASLRVDFASLDYRIVHTGADGREKELRFESVAGARQPFSTIDCKTVANDCNGS